MAWRKATVNEFLIPREERYKANDSAIAGMPRIEKINFSGNVVISQKPSKTDMIVIHPGDFVISGINVAKGAMAVYQGTEPVKATIHYSSYTVNHNVINLEYFKRFLKSPVFVMLLKEQVPGGIKTEIKPKHLMPLVIDLPEMPKQETILSRFLNTEEEYEELTGEIRQQKSLLNKYRQAILQEAIEGKLTADWRAANPDVEPASELLKRIATEKAELVKQKKIRKQKPLPPIKPEDIPFDIPNTWKWCKVWEVFLDSRYGTAKKCHPQKAGVPVLRIPNVSSGKIALFDLKYTSLTEKEREGLNISPGNLIYVRSNGSSELVGVSVVATQKLDGFAFAGYLVRIRLPENKMSPVFLQLYINSPFTRSCIEPNLRTTTGVKNINSTEFGSLSIPLPPLAEQEEIIRCVETKFALCDAMENEIETSEYHAKTLSAVILQEVFDHKGGHN